MKLIFRYGIKFELYRIKSTIAKLDWYTLQGYQVKIPENITKNSPRGIILDQIKREYVEEDYRKISEKILSDFVVIEKQFGRKLKEVFHKRIPTTFVVYLTNYGVGGSYNLPNIIVFNINNLRGVKTIVHETVHIIIEPLIQKYRIQHWEKERIVELILSSDQFKFLNYGPPQNYGGNLQYVDDLFREYFFKNPNLFFQKLTAVKQGETQGI